LYDAGVEYGILIDPTDVNDIAQALLGLLSDASRWETFSQRGHQRIHERYTWERTAEAYLKHFNLKNIGAGRQQTSQWIWQG
jgi:sucrose-phosphate synthase